MNQLSIPRIIGAVCQYYNVPEDRLVSTARIRSVAWPRQVAMYLARRYTKNSYPRIGQYFGNRDHSTIIYAVEITEERMEMKAYAEKIKNDIEAIKKILNGASKDQVGSGTSFLKPAFPENPTPKKPNISLLRRREERAARHKRPRGQYEKRPPRKCLFSECNRTFIPEHPTQFMCQDKVCKKARRRIQADYY